MEDEFVQDHEMYYHNPPQGPKNQRGEFDRRVKEYTNPRKVPKHFYEEGDRFSNMLENKYGLEDVQKVRKSPRKSKLSPIMYQNNSTSNLAHSQSHSPEAYKYSKYGDHKYDYENHDLV